MQAKEDEVREMHPARLVALVCTAQVLAQIGAYTWPALLPGFLERWPIDNTGAGWITGVFYLAYVVAVPVLVSLTDRVDPRRIYLLGVGLTVVSHAAFALAADGLVSALVLRVLAGIGWAGTYMTGLKLLADRVDAKLMSRAVAGHAAGVGLAGALSFVFAGGIEAWLGWRGAFGIAALCAAIAWLIALVLVPGRGPPADPAPSVPLLDFRPVLRNRPAMAYAAAYCAHTWEMNALRGWVVAFLAYAALGDDGAPGWLAPVAVATAMALLGTGASIAGNELSIRIGRVRLVRLAMRLGIVLAMLIGWVASLSYLAAVAAVVLYGIVIWLDSSSLTAGTAGSADPRRRGATLAVHSMLGYAGGFVGPVAVGVVLDAAGGMSDRGWWLAFAHLAVVGLAGRIVFERLGPRELPGEG